MNDVLNPAECDYLMRAWNNFDAVLRNLSPSEIREFLFLGVNYILEELGSSAPRRSAVWAMTADINQIVANSPFFLDIDSDLNEVNQMVVLACQPLAKVTEKSALLV